MNFTTISHTADLCVIGGGLAGLCAAVAAARHGTHTLLMQERPMLGGNASSEIRMWVCGAHGSNNRETGLIEELMLENQYRNPNKNYSIWDGILYELARYQPGLELLLNCSCNSCEMNGSRITSITGWQLTTQQFHHVTARIFADCSGDSVLAPLTGAEYRIGREARAEFGEDIAPETADLKTMGLSCMLQAREEPVASEFIPPKWAYHYTRADLPYRLPNMKNHSENFWYLELGGDMDSIADTEAVRDELLKIAYGIWDYVKNAPENRETNKYWRLDWMGILPGKRESRRYVGDVIMTQHNVRAEGRFEDIIAYGGWTMDDHHPGGFRTPDRPNIFHPAPSPYGIPYRSTYSVNIANLMFAGRNISVTHTALSSTRVMATCATLGQAVGTAAAIAIRNDTDPRGVYQHHLHELQQALMEDDCYLPFNRRDVPELTRDAVLTTTASADVEPLRSGIDRPVGAADNGCVIALGESVRYSFADEVELARVRLVFDSDLDRASLPEWEYRLNRNMIHNRPMRWPDSYVPRTITRDYRVEVVHADGTERVIEVCGNYQRLCVHELESGERAVGVVFTPIATWGSEACHVFAFDCRARD